MFFVKIAEMLIIVCGLQGTGKTYVAGKIAEKVNANLLRTDVIRKELSEQNTYSGKEIQNIYQEMFVRAETLLRQQRNTVLDATFSSDHNRKAARQLAASFQQDFILVEVVCDEKVVEKRITARKNDASDADFNVYLKYKSLFDPLNGEHIIIENSGTIEETELQIEAIFNLFSQKTT